MTPTQKEINALVDLLEEDWETPVELAKALITTLDKARTERTTYYYIAVVEYPFGHKDHGKAWYEAVGPFAGQKSAKNALDKMLATVGKLARVGVVVPVRHPAGYVEHLKRTG